MGYQYLTTNDISFQAVWGWARKLVSDLNKEDGKSPNLTPGTFGSETQSITVTFDDKGRATSVAAQTVTPAYGSITGIPASKLLGRKSATTGIVELIEPGSGSICFGLPATTRYVPPDTIDFAAATTAVATGTLYYLPFSRHANIAALAIEVTVAGAAGVTARLALYRADGAKGVPGTLIQDLGTVLIDTIGIKEIALPAVLTLVEPMWFGLQVSGTATIRSGAVAASQHKQSGSDTLTTPTTTPVGLLGAGAYAPFVANPALIAVSTNPRMIAAKLST